MQQKVKRPTLKQYLKTHKIDRQIQAQGIKYDETTVLTSESKAFNDKFKQLKKIIRNSVKDIYEYSIIDQKMDQLKEMAFEVMHLSRQSFDGHKSQMGKSETDDSRNLYEVKIPTKNPKKSHFNKENQKIMNLSKTVGSFGQERPSILKNQHSQTWQNFRYQAPQPKNVKFSNNQKISL